MNEKEQKTLVTRIVAAVAWADGEVSKAELKKLAEIVKEMGGLDDTDTVSALESTKKVEDVLSDIEKLPMDVLANTLQFCYRMAASDNGIDASEEEVMLKIALEVWPEHKANLLMRWLMHSYHADEAFMELFMLPQNRS